MESNTLQTEHTDPTRIGTFTLAEYLIYMKRGARIQVAGIAGTHLPLWVEVTDFDVKTRLVTYRIMTNEELTTWPDDQRAGWNYC
jgi:hypothetical protein